MARRRRRKQSFSRAMARPLLALLVLGLIWVATRYDVHNSIARALIAPLAKTDKR
jgi:hypothetical protein